MKKIIRLAAALCAAASLAGCAAAPTMEAPQLLEPVGVEMDTVQVQRGEIYDMASYQFAVVPATEEVLHTADGTIMQVCVLLGQKVEAGDVLLKLDVSEQKEQLEQLDARIKAIEEENELTLRLLEMDVKICEAGMGENRDYSYGTQKAQEKEDEYKRVTSALEQEKERQELQREQLHADRAELTRRITESELKAPCAGSVVYIAQGANEAARADSVAVMLATEEMQLRGEYISEAILGLADEITAQVGSKTYRVEYLPMEEKEYISLVLSGAEMNTEFVFTDGTPAGIAAGDYALVCIKSLQQKDVLYLPVNAVEQDAVTAYVYRATENGGRERVDITVGERTPIAVEITAGLQEGDVVYVP